jgi:5-(carboxyamino)imidazole ribonucleotide mutase
MRDARWEIREVHRFFSIQFIQNREYNSFSQFSLFNSSFLNRLAKRRMASLKSFGMNENEVKNENRPLVAIIMGSKSDWETMRLASETLQRFDVMHECHIVSAHRTPQWLAEFASTAEAKGYEVIIAGAGGAAHLPGMAAAQTILPVLGVPVQSKALNGMDSLLSIVQMPAGIPVGTLAIGNAGATNAALLAVAILASSRPELREKLRAFRDEQTQKVMDTSLD